MAAFQILQWLSKIKSDSLKRESEKISKACSQPLLDVELQNYTNSSILEIGTLQNYFQKMFVLLPEMFFDFKHNGNFSVHMAE